MTYKNFHRETDADGIALVTWDMPGRSMNVINTEVVGELGEIAQDHARIGAEVILFAQFGQRCGDVALHQCLEQIDHAHAVGQT